MTLPGEEVLNRIAAALGSKGWSRDAATLAPYLSEWRGRYHGATPLLARPASTEDVAAVVTICAETGTAIVPQGGNTGLVGGQIPTGPEILLSLSRLNRIRDVDPAGNTLTAEAGVVLTTVRQAAADAGRLFPLSLASEGSATIGGLISTNAGGVHVLRYGMMRDLVLGLEAVLPDGRIWNGLTCLYKDNRGYDLKQLFIGAEGTLGVVTAAVLKLKPCPPGRAVAWVAVPDVEAALNLLRLAETRPDAPVAAFELIPRIGLDFVLRHAPGTRDPLTRPALWYVLAEVEGGPQARPALESLIEQAVEREWASDGVIAQNTAQERALWDLRERLSEVQKHEGGSIKHDIAVPVPRMAAFIAEAARAVTAACPGARPVPFGHVGDGNVHFNVSQPLSNDMEAGRAAFLDRWQEITAIVHGIARKMGGSFSAEHGIGVMKRAELAAGDAVALDLMRRVKRALDPKGIMNPGKLL